MKSPTDFWGDWWSEGRLWAWGRSRLYGLSNSWALELFPLDSQSPQEPTGKNDFQQPGGGYVGYTTANRITFPVRRISLILHGRLKALITFLMWAKLAGPINADFSWKHIHWPNSFSHSIKSLVSTVLNKAPPCRPQSSRIGERLQHIRGLWWYQEWYVRPNKDLFAYQTY